MDSVLNFLADYYLVFIIISGVLLFALIGFIVMSKKKPEDAGTAQETPGVLNAPQTLDTSVIPQPEMTQAVSSPQPDMTAQMQNQTLNLETPAQAPVNQNSIDQQMAMVPEEPVRSDEPTLIINDPSLTPSTAETVQSPQPDVTQTQDNTVNSVNNQ